MLTTHSRASEEINKYAAINFKNTFEEEKQEEKEQAEEQFTLFDKKHLLDYLALLKTYQEWRKKGKNLHEMRMDYIRLLETYPDYAFDTQIELAELYFTHQEYERAIFYYETVLIAMPEYYSVMVKRQIAYQKLFEKNNCVDKSGYAEIKASTITIAKQVRKDESEFRMWYNATLYNHLPKIYCSESIPTTEKTPDFFHTGINEFSNGGATEAFWGYFAFNLKKYKEAKFFLKKAVLKFEHDFISITLLAVLLHEYEDKTDQALDELSKSIKKYGFSSSYFDRMKIYYAWNEMELAKQDAIEYIKFCSRSVWNNVEKEHKEKILLLLTGSSTPPARTICETGIQEVKTRIATINSLVNNKKKFNPREEIAFFTQKIAQDPHSHELYSLRAKLYCLIDEFDMALLNFSIAICLQNDNPNNPIQPEIFDRACIHLSLGKTAAAHDDFGDLIGFFSEEINTGKIALEKCNAGKIALKKKTLEYIEKSNAGKIAIQEKIGLECLEKGNSHLDKGNFEIAEKVFLLGITIKPNLDLYFGHAISLGLQENYAEALSRLDDIKKFSISLSEAHTTALDKAIKHFTKFRDKQIRKQLNPALVSYAPLQQDEKPEVLQKTKRESVKTATHSPRKKKISNTFEIQFALKNLNITEEIEILGKTNESDENLVAAPEPQSISDAKKSKRKRKTHTRSKRTEPTENSVNIDAFLEEKINQVTQPLNVMKNKNLTLIECEKILFNLLAQCKADHPDKTFKTYITGGWAYDRVREEYFGVPKPVITTDIDIVTEIPFEILEKYLPGFKIIPQVPGLIKGAINGISIDIISRPDLNLSKDTLSRDFFAIYFDENGKVYDSAFGFKHMQDNILASVGVASEVFKNDPPRIFRAIYNSIKRSLTLKSDLKKQIEKDKKLLVPRPETDEAPQNLLLSPYRINSLLKRNFSQKLALKNYDLIYKFGLFEILFPEISEYMRKDNEWLRSQMQIADIFNWPKLEIIYANFLACAIMPRVAEMLPQAIQERSEVLTLSETAKKVLANNLEKILIAEAAESLVNNSLLFKNIFPTQEKLQQFLLKSIAEWKNSHAPTPRANSVFFSPSIPPAKPQPATTATSGLRNA